VPDLDRSVAAITRCGPRRRFVGAKIPITTVVLDINLSLVGFVVGPGDQPMPPHGCPHPVVDVGFGDTLRVWPSVQSMCGLW
jgi:hypothetical protein